MLKEQLKEIFEKYLDDTISPEELSWLFEWMRSAYDPSVLDTVMSEAFTSPDVALQGAAADKQEVLYALLARISGEGGKPPVEDEDTSATDILEERVFGRQGRILRLKRWRRSAIAAAVLIFLAVGVVYYIAGKRKTAEPPTAAIPKPSFDAAPGINGATLTLSDGSRVALDTAANKQLPAIQGDAHLNRSGNVLAYVANSGSKATALYNTLQTARGMQYSVVLSDGTKVWLNAGSSIRYPVVFSGKERSVEASGELYFEVAADKDRPFVVRSGKTGVTVLGTRFDLINYDDEAKIKVALLQGSVRVDNGVSNLLLAPGFQGEMDRMSGDLTEQKLEGDRVIAWTKGLLDLDNADFGALMRQIGRWYDVNVVFQGTPPTYHFGGVLHRDVNLSTILDYLSENGLRYTTEGKTITIIK